MSDYVGEICAEVNRKTKDALQGVAQPLADVARRASDDAAYFHTLVEASKAILNQTQVASRGEVESEQSLTGKVRHLVFIAEAAERAEADLREEVCELREQIASLAFTFAEIAGRHANTAA